MALWLKAAGKWGGIIALIALLIALVKQLIAFVGFLTAAIKLLIIAVFIALFIAVALLAFRAMSVDKRKKE